MTILAVIQARMRSTRLPGKVMRHLCGRSVLGHVILRVRLARRLDEVLVATTTQPEDHTIVQEAEHYGVRVYRGSEDDVLARYFYAAQGADIIVRVTSDCPLFDPQLLDGMIERFQVAQTAGLPVDYLSNTLIRTYPRGVDAEIFSYGALRAAHERAREPYEREHVTPYIYMHPERFVLENYASNPNLSHLRWTLDTPEDLRFIEEVYGALYREGEIFSTAAILTLLEGRPELAQINAHVPQKALSAIPRVQVPPGSRNSSH